MHDVKLRTLAWWLADAAWYEHHCWGSPNQEWEVPGMKVVDRRMKAVTAAPGGLTENEPGKLCIFWLPHLIRWFILWFVIGAVSMLLFWSHPLSFTNCPTHMSTNSALHWALKLKRVFVQVLGAVRADIYRGKTKAKLALTFKSLKGHR